MTNPAARVNRRPYAPAIVLPMLLTVALLIPMGVLFGQVWRDVDGDRSFAARERDGIGYLRALVPVATALADAQSAAVTGRPVPREVLTRAVRETAAVDARLGSELRTQERWASLRAKIEALPDRSLAGPADALTAYREATDLVLALFDKVRDRSGLVRDPDADSNQLQQAAARDLPNALVAAGRLADAVTLAPARPAGERLTTVADLTAARLAALAPATDVVTALQSAVDSTQSTELGGDLLAKFDRYQQAVAALALTSAPQTAAAGPKPAAAAGGTNTPDTKPSAAGGTNTPGTKPSAAGSGTNTPGPADPAAAGNGARTAGPATPDPAKVGVARVDAQAAATELSTIILTELDTLIRTRADRLDNQRWLALGAAAVAVLIALAALARTITAVRRRRSTGTERTPGERPGSGGSEPPRPPLDAPVGETIGAQRRWEPLTTEWAEPVPVGLNSRPALAGATVRDNQPTHWGRTDAAR